MVAMVCALAEVGCVTFRHKHAGIVGCRASSEYPGVLVVHEIPPEEPGTIVEVAADVVK